MSEESKKVMMMLSIVEAEKGHKLIELLEKREIKMNMQVVGYGTAPTEMMDIFGLGSNDKDIILSMASKKAINALMANFGDSFTSYTKYGGLLIVLNVSAVNRLVAEGARDFYTPLLLFISDYISVRHKFVILNFFLTAI